MNTLQKEFNHNLLLVGQKLKNHIVYESLQHYVNNDELLEAFKSSIEIFYSKTKEEIVELNEDGVRHLNLELDNFLKYINNIASHIVEIVDILVLFTDKDVIQTKKSLKSKIDKDEFSRRYDKLINLLNNQDEHSNLTLFTKKENVPFSLFKNKNSIVIKTESNKSNLSTTKNNLMEIAYGEKESNLASYTPSINEKIFDNSIFDEINDRDNYFEVLKNTSTHVKRIEELENEKDKLYGKINQLDDKVKESDELLLNIKTLYENASSLEEDYKNAKETVINDIRVQDSYTYWEEQILFYSKRYTKYLWIAIIASFLLLSVIMKIDSTFVTDAKAEIVKTVEKAESKKDVDSVKASMMSLDFIKYGFMILLISLAIWIIRIVMKIALSSYHLSIDAKERVIMIKTYLSLMKEGNTLAEDDKKVMIESIFRPTNHGIVKDESSVTVTDIISSFKK